MLLKKPVFRHKPASPLSLPAFLHRFVGRREETPFCPNGIRFSPIGPRHVENRLVADCAVTAMLTAISIRPMCSLRAKFDIVRLTFNSINGFRKTVGVDNPWQPANSEFVNGNVAFSWRHGKFHVLQAIDGKLTSQVL